MIYADILSVTATQDKHVIEAEASGRLQLTRAFSTP